MNPQKIERRTVELRVDPVEGEAAPVIRGHAAVFDSDSLPIAGMFVERIARGAFKKTLQEADVRALVNHDPNRVLGRNKAGTLRLAEDKQGLSVEIDPPDTTYARDLMESMRRGDINQMSFGFQVVKEKWDRPVSESQLPTRTLHEVALRDVSIVAYPAYPATDVSVRSAEDIFATYAPDSEPGQPPHSEEVAPVTEPIPPVEPEQPLHSLDAYKARLDRIAKV